MPRIRTQFPRRQRHWLLMLGLSGMLCAGCSTPSVRPSRAFARPHVVSSPNVTREYQGGDFAEPSVVPEQPVSEVQVVESLESLGARLRTDGQGNYSEADLSFTSAGNEDVRRLAVLQFLTELDLTGTSVDDEGISSLGSIQSLRAVKLKGTKITSNGLTGLPTNLILFDASNTAVTDDSLQVILTWSELRYLSLNNTAITDAGLEHLRGSKKLRGLSLINTGVSEAGIKSLKESLPDCLIVAQADPETSQTGHQSRLPRLSDPVPSPALDGFVSARQLDQVAHLAELQPHLAVHLSQIYSQKGQWASAARVLATASVANPEDREIHFALGEALARIGQTEVALEHFSEAVDEAEARYHVGVIVYENSLRNVEKYFDDAVQADPSLLAAQQRRDQIHRQLSQLRASQGAPADSSDSMMIEPASKQVRTASRSLNR
jgi:tetratricopeptide (TPR) repeat protein